MTTNRHFRHFTIEMGGRNHHMSKLVGIVGRTTELHLRILQWNFTNLWLMRSTRMLAISQSMFNHFKTIVDGWKGLD